MPKYFYTDPLKAAWMAIEFGMKFQEGLSARFLLLDAASQLRDKKYGSCFYYIRRDNLHIINPIKDDIGETKNGVFGIYHPFGNKGFFTDEGIKLEECEIIRRNKKAFFMPEVEQ